MSSRHRIYSTKKKWIEVENLSPTAAKGMREKKIIFSQKRSKENAVDHVTIITKKGSQNENKS